MQNKHRIPSLKRTVAAVLGTLAILLSLTGNAGYTKSDGETETPIASLINQPVGEAPGIVTVITAQQIEDAGARDLRDVLEMVPGIELGMRDIGYTQLGIRGIITPNSEKVKIMVDEIPVNEHLEGSGTIVFSELPVDNIARVEVIKGPASSLYGANAFAGVINIVTRKAEDIGGLRINIKGGSFNTRETGLLFGKCLRNFKLKAYLNYSKTDGMEVPIEEDVLSSDPYNQHISLAGTADGHTREAREKITAALDLEYKNIYLKSFLVSLKKEHYYFINGALGDRNKPEALQLNGVLGYRLKLNEEIRLESRLYSCVYKVDNFWENNPPDYYDPIAKLVYPYGRFHRIEVTQQTLGTDLRLFYTTSLTNTLIMGIAYERSRYVKGSYHNNTGFPEYPPEDLPLSPGIFREDPQRRVFSIYLQDQWRILKNLQLTTGVRYYNYNDTGRTINPRFAIVLKPFKKARWKILYGQAFRLPTFVELYLFSPGDLISGNKNNEPETLKTIETEFIYDINPKTRLRIDCFYTSINELINQILYFDQSGVLYQIEYRNLEEETVIRGLEVELRKKWGRKCSGFINYSYQEGENKFTGMELTGMANHIFNAGLNLEWAGILNFYIAARVVGPRKRNAGDPRDELNGYTIFNATITGKKLVKNLQLQLSIHNLFNTDCRAPEPVGNLYNDFPLPNSTRSVMVGLEYLIK